VTVPREARAFLGVGEEAMICAMQHRVRSEIHQETFPVLLLLTDKELQRREQKIIDDQNLTPERRFALMTKLNGGVRRMAVDAQHRVVLPAHFVTFLGLEKDLFFVCTNTTVQIWNPKHYLRWSGQDRDDHFDTSLDAYITI
jgi:DNA-binding transcriptional regulator/RsmH inhibitor MraZ